MSSEAGSWEVRIRKPAGKSLRAASRPDRERLLRALAEMQFDPFSGDVSRLKQELAAFRRRVGNWRIFFDVDVERRLVEVPLIERRTTTTYRKRR